MALTKVDAQLLGGTVTADSSGNVGIGTSTLTAAKTTIAASAGSSDLGATGNALYLNVGTPSTTGNYIRLAGAVTTDLYYGRAINADAHVWGKVGVGESMRIDSSGNLLVGTTNTGLNNSNSMAFQPASAGSAYVNHINGSASGNGYFFFGYNGGSIGSITQNGTTAVAYNTSSDYRLKNSIAPMTGALAKVALLKPCTYKWNSDDSDGEGFIAHELAEVCPHAVTGEKDAVDEHGNPKYQGIDTSFLVATLTAAIQEQQAIIEQLQADVAALKAK